VPATKETRKRILNTDFLQNEKGIEHHLTRKNLSSLGVEYLTPNSQPDYFYQKSFIK